MTGREAYKQLGPEDRVAVDGARHCATHSGLAEALFGGRGPGLPLAEGKEDDIRGEGLAKFKACGSCKSPEDATAPATCSWSIRPIIHDDEGKPHKGPARPCGRPLPCPDHPDVSDDETAAEAFPNAVPNIDGRKEKAR